MSTPTTTHFTQSANSKLGILVGVVFVLLGFCGFFVYNPGTFFDTTGDRLFEVWGTNPAHTLIWIVIGAGLLIAGFSGGGSARSINGLVGVVFVVLGIVGFFVMGTDVNFLALNLADNITHLIAGVLLLLTAAGADRPRRAVARA
ncbi:DUF4383 domain-containing protein [Frigoribacterium sp. 2-23]|uniref:DUF4383 domain-containing protein n=1 Tax=Frigoribacterium sp. 2-23 TaxID=3415006 RepID=UPI003C6EB923